MSRKSYRLTFASHSSAVGGFHYLLCALVCMTLCIIVKCKQPGEFEAKMVRQLFNVINIKYCFLSNDGHSVRFLNRFGKLSRSSNTISEMFFFT